MELTLKERLTLVNQYLILEKLYPERAEEYQTIRTALESGYALEYQSAVYHFSEEGLSKEECREVLDILDMYRALTFSYRDLADKTGIEEHKIVFPGFDGNNEGAQLGYATYRMETLGHFEELHRKGGYNSHHPTLDRYRRMLKVHADSADSYNLTKEDIQRIIAA